MALSGNKVCNLCFNSAKGLQSSLLVPLKRWKWILDTEHDPAAGLHACWVNILRNAGTFQTKDDSSVFAGYSEHASEQ